MRGEKRMKSEGEQTSEMKENEEKGETKGRKVEGEI